MRKVVATELLTLDGVVESTEWSFPFFNEEERKYKRDELVATGALLLGRVTYQIWEPYWPTSDDEPYASLINQVPKYVVSTTLDKVSWGEFDNATLIKGNAAEEVAKLKQQPGQDIFIHGSAQLVNSLMPHGLIDEYHLMVFPVVLGSGRRLFEDGLDKKVLKLVDAKTSASGVAMLTYRPK